MRYADLAISGDGQLLAAIEDARLTIWKISTGAVIAEITLPKKHRDIKLSFNPVTSDKIALSADGFVYLVAMEECGGVNFLSYRELTLNAVSRTQRRLSVMVPSPPFLGALIPASP